MKIVLSVCQMDVPAIIRARGYARESALAVISFACNSPSECLLGTERGYTGRGTLSIKDFDPKWSEVSDVSESMSIATWSVV